ncbi:MAG: acyltransferase [Myxococcales bacterium]|nr:acyltransferase [Myxococcales bacterium]
MVQIVDGRVAEQLARLDVPFNRYGYDAYGTSRAYISRWATIAYWFYENYFRVTTHRVHLIPDAGRGMLIGNHSGAIAIDGSMVLTSLIMEHDPPRMAHGMVEKFAYKQPFLSNMFNRLGQLTGVPGNAERILNDERLLLVFPEGARGTGKLYKDRYRMERFGTGFMRLALSTGTPIIPFAFIGGEEAIPQVMHINWLAKVLGTPYIPVTPYLAPLPLPVKCDIYYGEPMHFEGDGTEADEVILSYVDLVKRRVAELMREGLEARGDALPPQTWESP